MLFPPENDELLQEVEYSKYKALAREESERQAQNNRTKIFELVARAEAFGLGDTVKVVLSSGKDYIEYWKNSSNIEDLNNDFTQSKSKKLRSALDFKLPSGATIQQFIINFLNED